MSSRQPLHAQVAHPLSLARDTVNVVPPKQDGPLWFRSLE